MPTKSCLVALLLFSFSCAYAVGGKGSIGTVSARGDVRVDGYTVQGNGTLFDGTAVETGQATATLRLDNGAEIKLATNSRGVVHRDRLVLLRGESQLKTAVSPYSLEADGLHVAPGGPNVLGVVALSRANTVDVASVTGEFRILDGKGLSLAHVSQGAAISLYAAPRSATPEGASTTTVEGLVSYENGFYYLTTVDGAKYILVGENLQDFVGEKVVVTGTLQAAAAPSGISRITVTSIVVNGSKNHFGKWGKILTGAVIAGGGAGAGIAIYDAVNPASR